MAIKMSEEEFKKYGLDKIVEEKERSKEKEDYTTDNLKVENKVNNKEENNKTMYNEEYATKNKKTIIKFMFILGIFILLFSADSNKRKQNEELRNMQYETLMTEIKELRKKVNTSEVTAQEKVDTSDKVYILDGTYYDYLVFESIDGVQYEMTESTSWIQNGKVIFDDGDQVTAMIKNGEITGMLKK